MAAPRTSASASASPGALLRDRALAEGYRLTRFVTFAFGAVVALRLLHLASALRGVRVPADLVLGSLINLIVSGGATLSLVVWIAQACGIARDHMEHPFAFTPGPAAFSLLIPILNLVQPYRVVTALSENADPADLPPVRELRANPNAGYREPAFVMTDTGPVLPPVPLALWWAMWIGSSTLGALLVLEVWGAMLCSVLGIASAALTIVIVRGVDLRRRERAHRMAAREREEARAA